MKAVLNIRRCAVTLVTAGALTASAVPTTASAAPGAAPTANTLTVAYDAVGSSTVAKTGSVVALGPSTLTVVINPDGTFSGNLPVPPSQTTFKALGLLPTKATVNFIPAGPLTGAIGGTGLPTLSSSASYYLRLSDVTVGGLPAFVGSSCQTSAPVHISTATPAGQHFDVTAGGNLAGTYTIGSFAHCGLTTALINLLIPGPNNKIALTLSNGRLIAGQ